MNVTVKQAQDITAALAAQATAPTTHTVRVARPTGALKTGANFTGQYLYDRFVANSKEEQTRMALVRQMADTVELTDFKTIVNDLVKIAKGFLDGAIAADKEAGIYVEGKPTAHVLAAAARHKTAQNVQNVLRVSYGALRFAADHLEAAGYDDTTGYNAMRVIGLAALKAAQMKWDGTKAEPADVKQARAAQAAENRAMLKVQEENPRQADEDRKAYFERIDRLVEEQLAADTAEQHTKRVNDLVTKIKALAGDDLSDVLDALALVEQSSTVH